MRAPSESIESNVPTRNWHRLDDLLLGVSPRFPDARPSAHAGRNLARARDIALRNGVRYAYVGNVHDHEADSTFCHRCGQLLIGRDWYRLTSWNLTVAGRCPRCQTPCAGLFESNPGS